MSRYNAELEIQFPGLARHVEWNILTEAEARRFKKALEAGEFVVKMFIEEKKEVA